MTVGGPMAHGSGGPEQATGEALGPLHLSRLRGRVVVPRGLEWAKDETTADRVRVKLDHDGVVLGFECGTDLGPPAVLAVLAILHDENIVLRLIGRHRLVRKFPRVSLAEYRLRDSVDLIPRQLSARAVFIEAAIGGE